MKTAGPIFSMAMGILQRDNPETFLSIYFYDLFWSFTIFCSYFIFAFFSSLCVSWNCDFVFLFFLGFLLRFSFFHCFFSDFFCSFLFF